MNVKIRMAILASVGFLFASPAHAGYVLLTFTGSGANGSVAWGKFTVGDTALVPNYYAPGNIYGSLSMTISNIPGPRPSVVSFTLEEINSSSFTTDSNGVPTIQPLGGHSFGPPDQFNYALAGGPQRIKACSSIIPSTLNWRTQSPGQLRWSLSRRHRPRSPRKRRVPTSRFTGRLHRMFLWCKPRPTCHRPIGPS